MQLTLQDVADLVGGRVQGNADQVIRGICGLEETGDRARDHLAFLATKRDAAAVVRSEVTNVLVAAVPETAGKNFVVVEDPSLAFARVGGHLHPLPRAEETKIHPTAVVAADAMLEDPIEVGPHAVIESRARIGAGTLVMAGVFVGEGCSVGRDCILYPHSVLYHEVELGDRVRIHANAVIGSDGFGNARDGARWVRIPQIGTVVIGDDVEVGACTTVDRATLGATKIGRGSRIDNLVMIGHNCEIGEDVALAGQVGMAGTTKIGDRVQAAGQVGLAGHLEITPDTVLLAKAGVMNDVRTPGAYVGQPAMPSHEYLRIIAEWKRATQTRRKVAELARRVDRLEGEG